MPDSTQVLHDPSLKGEHVPLAESVRRYRAQFPDVVRDPELSAVAYRALHQGLATGMRHHEALPIAGRIARKVGQAKPVPDSLAERSAAIREIARGRGQGGPR